MLNIDIEYKRGILFVRLDGILNEKTSCILEDALKSVVQPMGVSTYTVKEQLPKELNNILPTKKELEEKLNINELEK